MSRIRAAETREELEIAKREHERISVEWTQESDRARRLTLEMLARFENDVTSDQPPALAEEGSPSSAADADTEKPRGGGT